MATETMVFLAEISLDVGLIGLDEYKERIEVALWLADDSDEDPRDTGPGSGESQRPSEAQREDEGGSSGGVGGRPKPKIKPRILEFIALKVWYFTGSDPDYYPSVPHGHYQNANVPWPKLNPYTGRVFSTKHAEDKNLRLSKKEMRTLWRDPKFRDHCRKQILWYMETYPHFAFPVRQPLRLPRW